MLSVDKDLQKIEVSLLQEITVTHSQVYICLIHCIAPCLCTHTHNEQTMPALMETLN